MPEAENKKQSGKPSVKVPAPASGEEKHRDEANLYGDDADIPVRLRRAKRAGAGKKRGGGGDEVPKREDSKTRAIRSASGRSSGRKKKRGKRRRGRRSIFDLMSATGSDSVFKPLRLFGRDIRFWPLYLLGLIAFTAFGVMLNNSNLNVVEQRVTVVGLPEALEEYRIAVLSDLNGRRFGDSQSLLLRNVNSLNCDAIFCLGDMVGRSGDATPFFEFLEGLNHPDRVYFICGDSDPGPFVSKPRNITGTLSEIVLEDWILGAIERGAHYVDAPTEIALKDASMWISPTTMLNLETVSTVETWKDQAAQEEDGVLAGLSSDYNTLPMTDYRYQSMQKLYEAQRAIAAGGIHICLSHERPTNEFIYTSESHDPVNERYLATPELILAGHYCNGVWRIPFVGALYVPDKTMARGGWFPEQALIDGLTSVDDTQIYVTGGLSTNGKVPLMPFRLFNGPEISVLTLTSTLPENMLEAG